MSNRNILAMSCKTGCMILAVLLVNLNVAAGQGEGTKIDFAESIKPILEKHCLGCHGPNKTENFRIDEKDEAMDYISVGSADESQLFQALISDDNEELMPPPDEKNPLSKAQIQLVKTWIDGGAEWPTNVKFVEVSTPSTPSTKANSAANENNAANNSGSGSTKPNTGKKANADPIVAPKQSRIFNAIGSLHPAAVHLPIGLLLAAGLFAMFSLRGNFVMSDCAYYCLWLGTVGAVMACLSGWWFSPMEHQGTVNLLNDLLDQDQPVFWHRSSALIVTIAAFLLALFAAGARNRDPDDGLVWKIGLILLACGVGFVGHEGGELTHGKHHYDDLKAVVEDLVPGLFAGPVNHEGEKAPAIDEKKIDGKTTVEEKPAEKEAPDKPDAAKKTGDDVGKSSDET